MNNLINPITIFDEFFIHCWYNSFASIVLENETYLNWIYNNSFNYVYTNKKSKNLYNWNDSRFFCIRTDKIFDELSNAVQVESYKLSGKVNEFIKYNLKMGKYIFVLCDRYYQVGHYEYNTVHNYHYSLVYGFNDVKKTFNILTDWRIVDKLEEYEIDKDSFEKSKIMADDIKLNVEEFNNNIYVITKKDKVSAKDYDLKVKDIYNNINKLICKDEIKDETYVGIIAIKKLAENVVEIINSESNKERLIKMLASSFAVAANNEVRNNFLCKKLANGNYLDTEQYKKLTIYFETLKKKWDVIQLLIIKLVSFGDNSIAYKIKERLFEIYELESEANHYFKEVLCKRVQE